MDEEEKDDGQLPNGDMHMAGAMAAPIQDGDQSPCGMEESKIAGGDSDKRQQMLAQLKKTKELRKNMKR